MITTMQLKKIGTGFFVLIPAGMRNAMEIGEDDFILVDVIKKIKINEKIKHYRCVACQHDFHTDDDIPYCPICDTVETVEQVRE